MSQVLLINPFKTRKGSVERDSLWTKIANNLNSLVTPAFAVNQRSVRDHLVLLQKKFRKKMSQDERASGICPEKTELDVLIEEINDIEEVAEAGHLEEKNKLQEKADQDKVKADDMKGQAVETFGMTKRRRAEDDKENIPK